MDNLSRRAVLGGSAALGLEALMGQALREPLEDPVLARPRIGAEFFLNSTETRDSIFEHFRRMAQTGLTVARIFTIWDQIEREQGKWTFAGYDWIYEAAAQHGLLIANTLCSEDPPGWMGTAPFYHAWRDLSDPSLRPHAEIYIEKVVTRYKSHPAHGVWLLQNEPGINSGAEPFVLSEYARWLERKYRTVEALNRVWYQRLARFEEAQAPPNAGTGSWIDYPRWLDWRRFRCDHLADQLRWIHSQIDRHHPGALTHINPPGLTSNMPAAGRDLWRLKPTADFMGASMHASWHFGMFAREDFGVAFGYCCDLIRSVSAPAPWWVTELQAGPTIFTGSRPLNPTTGEITRWLWDGIGNGARGIVFWLWHPRTEGVEAGEWALAGPRGEPTGRTRATQSVAEVLRRHDSFFAQARPVAARAAILYNRDAMLLYSVDGARRPGDDLLHSLMGCYKALHRSRVPVDFLDTSELETGLAGRYKVLYLPYCYALSAKAVNAIRQFVRAGGTVWADGLVGWKDEQGATRQFPPGPLSDVFGFTLEDIDASWEPFALAEDGQDKAGELWRCLIPPGRGKVLVKAADGRPAAVENSFGAGRAIYYGTALTLGYLHRDSPMVREWIAAPAREASGDLPLALVQGPEKTSFRGLHAPGRAAAVLSNWGEAGTATVRFPASTSAVELVTGNALELLHVDGYSQAVVRLPAGECAVVLAELRSDG
jgi:beta-galactosidase